MRVQRRCMAQAGAERRVEAVRSRLAAVNASDEGHAPKRAKNEHRPLALPPHDSLMTMHRQNRLKLAAALRASQGVSEADTASVVVLRGGDEVPLYDTDTTLNVFQQESNFQSVVPPY